MINLDAFRPLDVANKANQKRGGKKGSLTMICSKNNGKRLLLSAELLKTLDLGEDHIVQAGFIEKKLVLAKKLPGETNFFKLRKAGKKYNYNERIFQNIDTPEKAYWAGFITADGCIEDLARTRANGSIYHNYRLRFCLAYKDINHLKKFIRFLNDESLPITDSYIKDKKRNKIHIGGRAREADVCARIC